MSVILKYNHNRFVTAGIKYAEYTRQYDQTQHAKECQTSCTVTALIEVKINYFVEKFVVDQTREKGLSQTHLVIVAVKV